MKTSIAFAWFSVAFILLAAQAQHDNNIEPMWWMIVIGLIFFVMSFITRIIEKKKEEPEVHIIALD